MITAIVFVNAEVDRIPEVAESIAKLLPMRTALGG